MFQNRTFSGEGGIDWRSAGQEESEYAENAAASSSGRKFSPDSSSGKWVKTGVSEAEKNEETYGRL